MRNEAISERLEEIADILEMKGVEFKPRAYRKAARRIDSLNEDVEDVYERGELTDVEGVGESIREKIAEFLETGEMSYYQELKAEYPVDVETLTAVEGVGPKTVARLHDDLGVQDLDDLEAAAREGAIADLEGFGERTQENILDHIEMARRAAERTLLGRAVDRAHEIRDRLADDPAFDRVTLVGSFRRRRPTVGDIDVLATADDAGAAMEAFCTQEAADEVLARGETKSSVVLPGDLRVDLRIVDAADYGAATVYFTGSKDHNVALRERAIDRGWKLNEYGLFDVADDEDAGRRAGERLAGETEAGVYEALDLDPPPPELRENTGEIDAAASGDLPDLVTVDDVRGDLQMHTTYSDGTASVREMAEAAAAKGHEYVLVTDHGPTIDVTTGLDDEAFDEQRDAVAAANDDLDLTVLHGVEADVTEDGLGVPDRWTESVDLLVAAMHDPPPDPTDRLCAVLRSYPVDVIAHPLNRRLHGREPIDLDLPTVVDAAAEEDVALEINAQPERLDLDWYEVKQYREEVPYVVSTDAHDTGELDYLSLGVSQARRGWCTADDVLNTRPLPELLSALGR
jgi:DNA polymerase (family 10)